MRSGQRRKRSSCFVLTSPPAVRRLRLLESSQLHPSSYPLRRLQRALIVSAALKASPEKRLPVMNVRKLNDRDLTATSAMHPTRSVVSIVAACRAVLSPFDNVRRDPSSTLRQ